MLWKDRRGSSNVDDRRGISGGGIDKINYWPVEH